MQVEILVIVACLLKLIAVIRIKPPIYLSKIIIGLVILFVIFSMFVGGTFAGFADMFSQLQKTLGATESIREILRGEGKA